jgi:hypothetical protein
VRITRGRNVGRAPRRRHRVVALLAGVGLVLSLTATSPAPVAAADPEYTWNYWPTNNLTPKIRFLDCYHRIQYGNFGSEAYAMIRLYSGPCDFKDFVFRYADSSGQGWQTNGQWTTGSDGCGPYFQKFISRPNAYILSAHFGTASHVRGLTFSTNLPLPTTYSC